MKENIKRYIKQPVITGVTAIAVMVLLYFFDQLWAISLFLPLVFVFTIKFPNILNSLLSRYVASLLFVYGLLQISAIVQFFVFPTSRFTTLAVIVAILSVLLIVILRSKKLNTYRLSTIVNRIDVYALICAAVFVVPVGIFLTSSNEALAFLGGLQGVDGVNHFIFTSLLSVSEHLDYSIGSYYPKGFHIATAFLQNGFGINAESSTWVSNARNYFLQYVVLGGALLYGLYYLFASLVQCISSKKELHVFVYIGASLAIGVAVSLFYLSNFVYNGFLSYFYICLTIVFGIIYLLDTTSSEVTEKYYKDKQKALIAFLLLCVGASMSWPLLTPILLLTAFIYFIYIFNAVRKKIFSIDNIVIVVLVLVNLISLYMQLQYAGSDSAEGVSLTGGLTVFHMPFVLAGIVIFALLVYRGGLNERIKAVLQHIFLPLIAFVIIFALSQYFLLGELRYYVIKTSFLLEILLIVVMVAALAIVVAKEKSKNWYYIVSIPIIAVSLIGGLIAISGNPLQDLRNIARPVTGVAMPAHFEEDTSELTEIASEGLIDSSNAITMHVSESGKLFTHMQDYYWSIAMGYAGTASGFKSLNCGDEIYKHLFKQDFSDAAQKELVGRIDGCIELAAAGDNTYYIVTDDTSEGYLKSLFTQSNVVFK